MSEFHETLSKTQLLNRIRHRSNEEDPSVNNQQRKQKSRKRTQNPNEEAQEQLQEASLEWTYMSELQVVRKLNNLNDGREPIIFEEDIFHDPSSVIGRVNGDLDYCVGCHWSPSTNFQQTDVGSQHDTEGQEDNGERNQGLLMIEKAIDELYPTVSLVELAKIVKLIYTRFIYEPMKKANVPDVPEWSLRSIYVHIKHHTGNSMITVGEIKRSIVRDLEMVAKCKWKCSREDADIFWPDEKKFELESKLRRDLIQTMSLDHRKLGWNKRRKGVSSFVQTLKNYGITFAP